MAAQIQTASADIALSAAPAASSGPGAHGPGPLLWQAWADAIVLYWEHLRTRGALASGQPLCVLDLGGAHETLAWAMPSVLAQRLAASSFAGWPLHYLHRAPDGALPAPPEPAADGAAPPLVCIGWRAMEGLPSAAYAVHHGALYAAMMDSGPAASVPQWQPCAAPPGSAGALLRHYAGRCASTPLTLPLAACALLEGIAHCSGGRYLLLGADHGIATEAQLRQQACDGDRLNLHALLRDRQTAGAATWLHQPGDSGLALYLACAGADEALPATLAAVLEHGHPQRSEALVQAAACLPPAQALTLAPALLRSSACDPALLYACGAALLANDSIDHSAAAQWRAVLPATWGNYRMPDAPDGFYRDIALLAATAGDWALARQCLHAGLEYYGENPYDLQLLASCDSASASLHGARQRLQRALAIEPSHAGCRQQLDAVEQRIADANRMHGYAALLARHGELSLEPLHTDHAPVLLDQFRDAGIADMTCLPELHTLAQTRQWIRAQRLTGGLGAYAVMHARWGLVGAVFLRCWEDAAYFYFWTGCDFQDRGYGSQAGQLLWTLAAHSGVRQVYTSVYACNQRSRRALERLGFHPLDIRAQAPDDDLIFLHKPLDPAVPGAAHARRLRALCHAIGSAIQFLPAQESGP